MPAAEILAVDDDPSILEALDALLDSEGYEVTCVTSGQQALEAFHRRRPSLVLLDVLMPGMSGLQVCQLLRAEDVTTPIIMLTAKAEESDRVLGLDLGADDYVVKPFGARELVARIAAALRRSERVARLPGAVTCGDVYVDTARRRVTLRGKEIRLTAREFELLTFLIRHRGTATTREELLERVWGYRPGAGLDTRTVDNHVLRLRRKLEQDPAHPRKIVTMRGAGYVYEGE